jgi:aldehyde dehydrogenase (NAD+)
VVDAVTERVERFQVGDPLAADTNIGPLVAERQRDRVEGYIAAGNHEEARLTTGGGRPAGQAVG